MLEKLMRSMGLKLIWIQVRPENRAPFESGEENDTPEFRAEYNAYRYW